ncbi:hypothetical protein M0R45_010318 [Rubus argutus]|uniref:Uncharacterized protein n=1 Tax=Rubus argutus TaxID=59490 RepID=A0AAW1Y6M4_RUBAR
MGGLRESWCFCKGVSKSEKMKAAIFSSKAPALAWISGAGNGISGTGFLIHRNLLLTTHVNLPSVQLPRAPRSGCKTALQQLSFPTDFSSPAPF